MPKTLTGAALKANRRRVLIDTARADMTTGHPDSIVALLVQAEKARPTRNPEPLRMEVEDAVLAADDDFRALVERFKEKAATGPTIVIPSDEAEYVGWARPLLAEALNRPLDLSVFGRHYLGDDAKERQS
jgi:anti-sigma factor ChrR (cupin superfamily)